MIDELDSMRIELGKLGIHFTMLRNSLPHAELKSFDKDLRAYGRVLDRLQAAIRGCKETGSNSRKSSRHPTMAKVSRRRGVLDKAFGADRGRIAPFSEEDRG